ncbi:hypothetical protein HC248_01932 [Polaromonas vacuolata]|uniref:DNA primase/polymerase bifunctional N-terminal domain-containing protein n=1 Tax=Polaromonas vacuolata TaxID=37448 RepID=A0A6H2HAK0_9BURK|nr:hypothetical protein [Polaromonas vacuolata]QJC56624.1 hypothetical protein HC248_01932 [Polaromonas vacuolata]
MLTPDFDAIPMELQKEPRWVVWRDNKVPFCSTLLNSKASVINPDSWSSFNQTQTAYEEGGYLGLGFVLNGDGIVGIDLDKCVHAGEPSPAALQLLDRINCRYVEFSPSGTGLRGFGYVKGKPIAGTSGQLDGVNVELYANLRYLTVTGKAILNGPIASLSGFDDLANAVRGQLLQKRTEVNKGNLPSPSVQLLSSSVGTLTTNMPTEEGQRNRCLFDLARYLRGKMPDASKDELREVVMQWHHNAFNVIGTKDFAVSWADFLNAWEKIRYPFGSILQPVIDSIDHINPIPARILILGYQSTALRLIRICSALQIKQDPEPFFLGARLAGDLIGVHFVEAAKILKAFVKDDVLTLISTGSGRKASRYRMNLSMQEKSW